jgi:large subunit ribosomal protein L10
MRKDKQLLLDEVQGQIDPAGSFVIMSYSKLKANTANNFRRGIAKMGGSVEVVRKRVLIKAAEAAGVKLDLDQLPGHIGLVFAGNDPIETTKFVFEFSDKNEKTVSVVGGRFEGQMYSGADVEKLSKLPSKDEMRAQFLATLEAPMSQTLAVMEALMTSVVYCLDNKIKQENPESKE